MVIDIHAHFSTEKPGIASDAGKLGFAVRLRSPEEHLEMMDRLGIDRAVISCPTQKYLDDRQACGDYIRMVNETGRDIVKKYPDRFYFCASLPLPWADDAAGELDFVVKECSPVAVQLCSNAAGQYLGDPALEPVFARLSEEKLPALLHPAAPVDYPKNTICGRVLPMFEFIADTTRSVLDLLAAGYMNRYPDLNIVVPHSGSCLPMALDRFRGSMVMTGRSAEIPMERIWYDIACDAYPICVPALLAMADPSHILFGTDYPANPEPALQERLALTAGGRYFGDASDMVLAGNAKRLLHLN